VTFLAVLLIFLCANAAVWAVAVSLDRTWFGTPGPLDNPDFWPYAALTVLLVSALAFVGFPWGYPLSLVIWLLAARHLLELPWPRWLVLFLTSAALSLVSWLAIFGAVELYRSSH